jgi:hypothetical protein
MSEFKMPTEIVELPSKGLLYDKTSELSNGTIEIKHMSAREEDILTNRRFIEDGTVLDRLLRSLIVTPINFDDLLIGDKNAIMIAARILGYGKDYSFEYGGESHTVDLSLIDSKPINEEIFTPGKNEFEFTLPYSKNTVTFKLLTQKDEQDIDKELAGLRKIKKDDVPELSTRLKYLLVSVEGKRDKADVRNFVDNYLLAKDSRALREYIKEIQPDVDLTFFPGNTENRINIPIGLSFFWPDI